MDLEKDIKPEKLFLVLGLVFGLIFLLVTPPFQVSDETSHFFKAYEVSEGHFFPEEINAAIPRSVVSTMTNFSCLQGKNIQKIDSNMSISLLNQPLNPHNRELIDVSNVDIYPPIPYLPSAFIISILKFFDLSPLILMYSGRIINLLFYILLIFFTIKITPIHKWVILLLALMPMTLFQAASLSADSLNTGLSFLSIAIFLNFSLVKDKINLKDISILSILIILLILSKQGYALLLLLFFIIPKEKFKSTKKRTLSFAFISIFSLTIAGTWNLLFKNLYIPHTSALISPPDQISLILSDPLNFLSVLMNTLFHNSFYLHSFVGVFGWTNVPLPELIVYIYLLVLILVSLVDQNHFKLNLKQKLIALSIFITISIIIILFEYITFTEVGGSLIKGIQGRYFIPVAPLFFLLFYNSKITEIINNKVNLKSNNFYLFNIAFIILVLSISISILSSGFYI